MFILWNTRRKPRKEVYHYVHRDATQELPNQISLLLKWKFLNKKWENLQQNQEIDKQNSNVKFFTRCRAWTNQETDNQISICWIMEKNLNQVESHRYEQNIDDKITTNNDVEN